MAEYVFLNETLVETDQAAVSIHDAGLLHGIGLFETMRSYHGKVFRLSDHLDRLFGSAQALNIVVTQPRSEIENGIGELLRANNLTEARLRLTLTRGSLKILDPEMPNPSTLFITAAPVTPYPKEYYEKGMTVIVSDYKQNPDEPTAGHKTINYFNRLLALQQAQLKQAGEAIWFSTTNRLAEGCISNIFLVMNDVLLTPSLDTPVLPGIIRKLVLELAKKNNMPAEEKNLTVNDLMQASEVFLTNSIMELMPVTRIEKHAVGNEKPGPIYQKLHVLYQSTVATECNKEQE
jgi:branched-chain amino acid aminotransferase